MLHWAPKVFYRSFGSGVSLACRSCIKSAMGKTLKRDRLPDLEAFNQWIKEDNQMLMKENEDLQFKLQTAEEFLATMKEKLAVLQN
jgi:hypothetical protein